MLTAYAVVAWLTGMLLPRSDGLAGLLAVGLVVGVIQAATSVNEQTLTFVPKLVVTALVLVMFGASMFALTADFAAEIFDEIARLGR